MKSKQNEKVKAKSSQNYHCAHFVLAKYTWAWGWHWSVDDRPSGPHWRKQILP